MKTRKIVIAGGTGFLGNLLVKHFQDKVDEIILLSRKAKQSQYPDTIKTVVWDGKSLGNWTKSLEGADVLINMVGQSVDCRYTSKNKRTILQSRIQSTTVLGKAIGACLYPPKVWLNSSTATIYRHAINTCMDEESGEIGSGFSVDVALQWEQTFFNTLTPQTRKVALRTAIVLGQNGGALPPLIQLTKFGFGGKQGKGNQKFSWIHGEDFVRSLDFIIQKTSIKGAINIVAPNPVTNSTLMAILRKSLGRPWGIPLSKPLLELGARLIKTETELILKSRNVAPKKLLDSQFTFTYTTIEKAINHLISQEDENTIAA